MRVIFDTSVLVAAARSRNGASFRLISMLPSPKFQIALSVALYTEWQAVLTRSENMPNGISREETLGYLRYLLSIAHHQDIHFLWRPFLSDPNDDMLVECALASNSRYIVTHNIKDFRRCDSLLIKAITPADFLNIVRD